jgi:hypothetical protein
MVRYVLVSTTKEIIELAAVVAMLWIHLAYKANMGRDFAFGMLRR